MDITQHEDDKSLQNIYYQRYSYEHLPLTIMQNYIDILIIQYYLINVLMW